MGPRRRESLSPRDSRGTRMPRTLCLPPRVSFVYAARKTFTLPLSSIRIFTTAPTHSHPTVCLSLDGIYVRSNHAYRRVAASRSRICDLSPREESIPRCCFSLLANLARFPNREFYVCATLHLLPYNVRAILAVPACTSFLDGIT